MPRKAKPKTKSYRCPDCRIIVVNITHDCPYCGFKGELEELME